MPEPTPRDPARTGSDGELRQDRYVGSRDLTRWTSPLGRWLADLARRTGVLLGPHQSLILILVFGAAVAALMTWLASEVYEAVVEADGVAVLDHPLLEAMVDERSPALDLAATAYTNVGGVIGMPVLAVTIMVVLALRRRAWTPVILIAAAGGGSLLMTVAGKDLIGRARPSLAHAVPPYEHSPSFPSGHSLNALVIAGIVAYLLLLRQRSRTARVLTLTVATVFALTIGLSRVYLGHHWFTDVLAAWILGAAWLAVVITAHRLYLTTRKDTGAVNRSAGPA
ncbi:MAG: phosphatase PAP2 family protein [Micrococcus sp.]|nr:phosphatase PAP2 family protein [Micrococcus sp.]